MGEWRLRVGFAQVPVPFIAALRYEDILRIGCSDEMAGFRLGNTNYDRPVPRRIAEDMGVPRHAFGQQKKAASMLFCHSLNHLTPRSMHELERFRDERLGGTALAVFRARLAIYDARLATMRMAQRGLQCVFDNRWPVLWRLQRFWKSHGAAWNELIARLIVGDYRVFEHSSPLKSDLPFLWATARIMARYRVVPSGGIPADLPSNSGSVPSLQRTPDREA